MDDKRSCSIAKITFPKLPKVICRKRLNRLLDEGRKKAVVWIAGPGGSGKTTLIASYLKARRLPALWYQIDDGDTDLSTFFYNLSLSAKKANPRSRKQLPYLTPEYLLGINAFTRRFFSSLYGQLKPPFLLVFDNYQDVFSDSVLHQIIHEGLSLIPDGIQVVLISRNEPPPMLARLRANAEMKYVGWDDLKLDRNETEMLVRVRSRKKLTPKMLEHLHLKTDGWAAGVVLMMEQKNIEEIGASLPASLSQGEIFEYFAAEVFERLEREIRDFLMKTAFLPKITAPMAAKLTDEAGADRILADLNRKNFFTTKHCGHAATYQYHPLFREFLSARAQREYSPETIQRVKNKAAHILKEEGNEENAVDLFIQSADWSEAAASVCRLSPELAAQGRTAVVKGWLDKIPASIMKLTPWLLYWRGVCIMPFSPAESKKEFDRAFESFESQGDRVGMFLSWAGAVDDAFFGADFCPLDRMISLLEKLLLDNPEFPSPEIAAQVTVSMFGALTTRQPYHRDIGYWETKCLEVLNASLDMNLRSKAGVYLTVYYLWMGEHAKAGFTLDLLRKTVMMGKASDLMVLTFKTTAALYDFFTASIDTCLQTVEETISLGNETGVRVWETHVTGHGLAAALSSGDLATADMLLDRMNPDPATTGRFDTAYYHFAKTWKAMIEEHIKTAQQHYSEIMNLMSKVGDIPALSVCYVVMYEMLTEMGRRKEAERSLAKGYSIARSMNSRMIEYMCLIVETHIAFKYQNEGKGLKLLRRAMTLGREWKLMNMYWWRPAVMSSLCTKALNARIEVDYVQQIIRKRNLVPDPKLPMPDTWPHSLRIRTMGEFTIVKDGKPIHFTGKVQQKPLCLLKAIIAFGGKNVPEEQIADALWPEADGYSAHRSCELALYRLRKLLGNDKAVQLKDEKLTLDERYCFADVWALERMFEKVEEGWKKIEKMGKRKKVKKDKSEMELIIHSAETTLAKYRGHFLPGDIKQPWTVSLRDRLRNRFINLINSLGHYWVEEQQYKSAVDCFRKGLEIDDLCEDFYQRLMICYHKLGRKAEAATTYRRCNDRMSAVLNITPSTKTEEIYQAICNHR